MENREFLEQIQQYAVRIGNAGDKELYGSGTLFLGSGRLMDVLTKDTIEKMKTKWNSFLEELWEI